MREALVYAELAAIAATVPGVLIMLFALATYRSTHRLGRRLARLGPDRQTNLITMPMVSVFIGFTVGVSVNLFTGPDPARVTAYLLIVIGLLGILGFAILAGEPHRNRFSGLAAHRYQMSIWQDRDWRDAPAAERSAALRMLHRLVGTGLRLRQRADSMTLRQWLARRPWWLIVGVAVASAYALGFLGYAIWNRIGTGRLTEVSVTMALIAVAPAAGPAQLILAWWLDRIAARAIGHELVVEAERIRQRILAVPPLTWTTRLRRAVRALLDDPT